MLTSRLKIDAVLDLCVSNVHRSVFAEALKILNASLEQEHFVCTVEHLLIICNKLSFTQKETAVLLEAWSQSLYDKAFTEGKNSSLETEAVCL